MNTLLLLRRIRQLPQEVIRLIYEYDDTFRRIFQENVLLIRTPVFTISEYTEEQFYEAVVARKKGDFLGRMLIVINCLNLNERFVPSNFNTLYDYYEQKYSLPYRHEVAIIRSIPVRRAPFQKLTLHYPSYAGPHLLHFAIWHKCPLAIADFVNAYVRVRQRKYMNTPIFMLNLYGIIDLTRHCKCTLFKKKYYERGTCFRGYHSIKRRVHSRKPNCRRVCKVNLQSALYYDLTLFQWDDGTLVIAMDFQRLWLVDATLHNLGIRLLDEAGYLNDVVHDMFQVRKLTNPAAETAPMELVPRVLARVGGLNDFAGFMAGQLL